MFKYITKRMFYMIFVFLIMSLILFFLYNLIPGDPARAQLESIKDNLTPEEYQIRYDKLRDEMGLNDPLHERYLKWFGGMLKLDFGESLQHRRPVVDVVKDPLALTIKINIIVVVVGLLITIPLGIQCALRRNSVFDKVVQVLTTIGNSIPVFIISLLFIYIFSVKLNWFPVSGMKTPNFTGTAMQAKLDIAWHLTLPLIIMVIGSLAGMTRYVRAAMSDALAMDSIKTARAKGLKEKVVIYRHAWRNALLTVVTLIINWFVGIFSGSLVVESMFNINGMGKFYMDSLNNQDYNVALAIQMLYIVIALLGTFISDLSYGIVDPRVRIDK